MIDIDMIKLINENIEEFNDEVYKILQNKNKLEVIAFTQILLISSEKNLCELVDSIEDEKNQELIENIRNFINKNIKIHSKTIDEIFSEK